MEINKNISKMHVAEPPKVPGNGKMNVTKVKDKTQSNLDAARFCILY